MRNIDKIQPNLKTHRNRMIHKGAPEDDLKTKQNKLHAHAEQQVWECQIRGKTTRPRKHRKTHMAE